MDPMLCGVDLGGTKISVALVTSEGDVVERLILRNYQGLAEDEITRMIGDAIMQLVRNRNIGVGSIRGVGIGSSGHVDYRTGTIITNSNLPGFTDYPLRDRLQAIVPFPVRVDNDANAQAYAEFCFGAGKGAEIMAFVTVSTGVGAGIIIDGRVFRGMTGTAGEIGHTIVNPNSSIRCGCGNYGCLMAHTSGLTLPQVIRQKLRTMGVNTDIDFSTLSDREINGELVRMGFERSDPLCTEVVYEYADYLAIGLYNLFQVLNPKLIVVGGGLTSWGDLFLDRVRRTCYRLSGTMMRERMEINRSSLGIDAAVIGAAALVLEPARGEVHEYQ